MNSLLPSATTLLSSLSNPLNVTLLASQLLSAPAIWDRHLDLITSRRILSVFHTSAAHLLQHEQQDAPTPQYPLPRGLSKNDWVKAVVNGADEKSPRWRHLLLIGGALLGFEGQKRQGLPAHLRVKLESALVRATNLALRETPPQDLIGLYSVVLALNHTFELLSDAERAQLDYDSLLPLLLDATFFSAEGLESGYYLGIIDRDVVQISGKKFSWSPKSSTFLRTRHISSKPLIASLGPLSRLIAHSVENVKDAGLVSAVMDRLSEFARTMTVQWRQNKLSEIDASEESVFLDEESLKISLPVLWQLLRVSMFAVVIVLRAALGRLLGDPVLAADNSRLFYYGKRDHLLTAHRCSICFHAVSPYAAEFTLHIFPTRPTLVFAIYVYKSHCH